MKEASTKNMIWLPVGSVDYYFTNRMPEYNVSPIEPDDLWVWDPVSYVETPEGDRYPTSTWPRPEKYDSLIWWYTMQIIRVFIRSGPSPLKMLTDAQEWVKDLPNRLDVVEGEVIISQPKGSPHGIVVETRTKWIKIPEDD
ncbi:hypothetical protein LCGC14_1122580 [marine sediment metagenome]|uniref:Uncharacterized protein n=1 Tax=marine sediment metagenome TaxID=412755 RepID=A0A0F9M8B1_9ZZZZ